jgi:hypothetical protein
MDMEFYITTIQNNSRGNSTSPTWGTSTIIGSHMMGTLRKIKSQANAVFISQMENSSKDFARTIHFKEMAGLRPSMETRLKEYGETMFLFRF